MDFLKIICTLAFVCSPTADAKIKQKDKNLTKNKIVLYKPISMDLSPLVKWTKVLKEEGFKNHSKAPTKSDLGD